MNKIGTYLLLFLAAIIIFFSGYYLSIQINLHSQEDEFTREQWFTEEETQTLEVIPGLSKNEIVMSVTSVDELTGGLIRIRGEIELLDFFLRSPFMLATRFIIFTDEVPVYIEKDNSELILTDISDIGEGVEILVTTEESIEEILSRDYFRTSSKIIIKQ